MRSFRHIATMAAVAAAALIATAPAAQAQFTLSNFNGTGFGYVFGGLTQTTGPSSVVLSGTGDGGAGFGYGGALNLSSLSGGAFQFTALALAGNQSDIQLLIDTTDVGAANNYLYYYLLPASRFNSVTFTTAISSALNNPDGVLDASNGFSFVGSGSAFAPNLNRVNSIQMEGFGFQNAPFSYRIDNLAIVVAPEPGALPLLAMGLLPLTGAFVARKRRSLV